MIGSAEVLAAASDGAPASAAVRVAATPPAEWGDYISAQYALALAARTGRATAAHVARLEEFGVLDGKALRDFLERLKPGADVATLERILPRLNLHERGMACACGVVVLGDAAPKAWRDDAAKLLLPYERPYFR